mgnify:CR=1 FL=1
MEINKNLVFLGMMGSGKTTLGKIVSNKLNKRFIDIDKEIEFKEGMKISDLFQKKGESFFRKLEEKVSLQNLKITNSVISLGGGAFINETVRKVAQKDNATIWLNWNLKTLIDRIKKNNKRPVASNLSNNELKDLLINRSKIYSKANYKIDCENMQKTEIVNKIIQLLKL